MNELTVELKNVSVKYRQLSLESLEVEAVRDFTCTFEHGKIYGFIGRNGAGKTSLLSVVAGYRQASSGEVLVNGEPLFENSRYAAHINFVYQRSFDSEAVRDLRMKRYFKKAASYRPTFDMDYAHQLLEKFNVPLKKRMKHLSKGQQSAVCAIIGLASRCALSIFDEVYLGMDAPSRDLFYRELLETQGRYPRIMVVSTHLISEFDRRCLFVSKRFASKSKMTAVVVY